VPTKRKRKRIILILQDFKNTCIEKFGSIPKRRVQRRWKLKP
jgi:hypothetical protein